MYGRFKDDIVSAGRLEENSKKFFKGKTGSNSTLTLANGALVECRALLEQFVPTRLTVHGGPYGEFDAASGGGVAAVHGRE